MVGMFSDMIGKKKESRMGVPALADHVLACLIRSMRFCLMFEFASAQKRFSVLVLDASPENQATVAALGQRLAPLVGDNLMLAVNPQPYLALESEQRRTVLQVLKNVGGEILLQPPHPLLHPRERHLTHHDLTGPLGRLIRQELSEQQKSLYEFFGRPATGLAPQLGRRSPILPCYLRDCGLEYCVDALLLRSASGDTLPLAIWAWDGRNAGLTASLGRVSGSLMALRPGSLPCLIIHPQGLKDDQLTAICSRIQQFKLSGRTPVNFRELLVSESLARLSPALSN